MACPIMLLFFAVPSAALSLRKIQSEDDHFVPDLTKKTLPQNTITTLDADSVRKAQKLWANEINTCAKPQAAMFPSFRRLVMNTHADVEAEEALLGQGPFDEFSELPKSVLKELQPHVDAMSHFSPVPPLPKGWNMRSKKDKVKVSEGDVAKAKDLFTTASCKLTAGSQRQNEKKGAHLQTCEFHNLYFEHGGFTAHVLDDDKTFPDSKTAVRMTFEQTVSLPQVMRIRRYKSAEEFAQYLSTQDKMEAKSGTTVLVTPKWHFNFGHAFYDSLYPAFVSLIQWGKDQTDWRTLLKMSGPCPQNLENKVPGACNRIENLMGDIGGGGLDYTYKLSDESLPIYRFENLIMGIGLNMQKLDMGSNFALGQGRELKASSLFRKKVYARLGLPEPSRSPPKSELQGIIIHNRRFGTEGAPPEWAVELIDKAKEQGVNLKYINWSRVLPASERQGSNVANNPSPGLDTFRSHMQILLDTDIHISAPGTAMMYQQFLRDGSVHINLGEDVTKKVDAGVPQYMEEYMAEGAPYIKALYHYPHGCGKFVCPVADNIIELVQEAKQLITDRFEIPVPVGANISPVGKVTQAYFYLTQDPDDIAEMAPFASQATAPGLDADKFSYHCAKFVGEKMGTGNDKGCSFNNCLLYKLMDSYGPPCPGCEWPKFRNSQ